MEKPTDRFSEEAEKPNVVLITMDTTRAESFGCYGHEEDTTPFLDSLAEQGVKIDRCVSQSNWTLPSHAALMSGKYPSEIGCMTRNSKFEFEKPLSKVLSEKGYSTIGITNVGFLHPQFGFDRGFDYYRNITELVPFEKGDVWKELKQEEWGSTKEKYGYFLTDRLKALDLKELANGAYYLLRNKLNFGDQGAKETNREARQQLKTHEEPFFLFLNYIEPHSPYRPPREWRKKFEGISRKEAIQLEDYDELAVLSGEVEMPSENMDRIQTLYDSEIAYLDSKIQELYEWLQETGRLENTVFIVTSDHGEHFGEHGLYKHLGDLKQENIHVPLIMTHPDRKPEVGEDEVLELKDLYNFVSGGCEELIGRRKANSVYSGLDSHYREGRELHDLRESELNEPRIASVTKDLKTIKTKQETRSTELDEFKELGATAEELEINLELPEKPQSSDLREHAEEVKSKLKKLGYNM
jgi:arylsulfatase A-like enzyme